MPSLIAIFIIPTLIILINLLLSKLKWTGLKLSAILIWVELISVLIILKPVFMENSIHYYHGFLIDKIGAYFIILTSLITAVCITHSYFFFIQGSKNNPKISFTQIQTFYILAILFFISMLLVFMCDNLGYLWINIELTTLLSAGLVYFYRSKHALEATWKYFIICSVGIAFALLGTILIYASSKTFSIEGTLNISELIEQAPFLNFNFFKFGFIFCLLGYGTKAGIFPLHSWLPDAHSEAPAPASALLSACLLNCALFALLRIYSIGELIRHCDFMQHLLIGVGCLTIFAASLFLIHQHGLKRLWSYSSIENVGLMLVAIGIGSPILFFLQALNHALAKTSLFLLSGNIIQITNSKELKDIRGLIKFSPSLSILLILSSLAITGTPPFGSFISEILLLTKLLSFNFMLPAIIIIVALTICFIAVFVHVGRITLGQPKQNWIKLNNFQFNLMPSLLISISLYLGFIINSDYFRGMY